ncbi:MAG TPA: AtpZ/AtpI family protein [Candidatus Saccharimonadales bacterium]|nr:AtpZ/AtpI family protein [Candidatus Saccharimonadales bacterium]
MTKAQPSPPSSTWDDDEEDEQPYKKSPIEVGPQVLLWLFVQSTLRVMVPAVGCMLLGIWIGKKLGHMQAVAIIGTFVGLGIAALLVWQQAKSNAKR